MSKDIKTHDDLNQLSAILTKMTVEVALKSEMDYQLGYDKNELVGHHSGNSRNDFSSKNLKGVYGKVEIFTLPRS